MYTSEEFENFDIFPKKYTVCGVIKYSLYITFMVISNIFMYSFYNSLSQPPLQLPSLLYFLLYQSTY